MVMEELPMEIYVCRQMYIHYVTLSIHIYVGMKHRDCNVIMSN